jgi:hypothetical protein
LAAQFAQTSSRIDVPASVCARRTEMVQKNVSSILYALGFATRKPAAARNCNFSATYGTSKLVR